MFYAGWITKKYSTQPVFMGTSELQENGLTLNQPFLVRGFNRIARGLRYDGLRLAGGLFLPHAICQPQDIYMYIYVPTMDLAAR
jgi:hypothetical protein